MPHGNRSMYSPMMAIPWNNTSSDTTFDNPSPADHHNVVSPRVQYQWGDISVFRTDLWNTHWFRRYKREDGQRNIDNAHSAPSIQPIQNHWKMLEPLFPALSTMAFSSDDSTCAPTSIPTPNEFSWLLHNEDALFALKQTLWDPKGGKKQP